MAVGRQDLARCYIPSDKVFVYSISGCVDADIADKWIDLGLQVLDNVIMTRWKVLPKEQCQGK